MRYCVVQYYDSPGFNVVEFVFVIEYEKLYKILPIQNSYNITHFNNLVFAICYWASIATTWNLRLMKLEPKEDFVTQYAASNQDKQVYVYK